MSALVQHTSHDVICSSHTRWFTYLTYWHVSSQKARLDMYRANVLLYVMLIRLSIAGRKYDYVPYKLCRLITLAFKRG